MACEPEFPVRYGASLTAGAPGRRPRAIVRRRAAAYDGEEHQQWGTAMTAPEDLQAEIERLRRENAQLKAAQSRSTIKVSEKGGVSVYGLGRFPITLYPEQWEKLLGMADQITAFIEENRDRLKWKIAAGE